MENSIEQIRNSVESVFRQPLSMPVQHASESASSETSSESSSGFSGTQFVGGSPDKPVVGRWTAQVAAQRGRGRAQEIQIPMSPGEQEIQLPEGVIALILAQREREKRERGEGMERGLN